MLEELNPDAMEEFELAARAEDTLQLMHDWGYAPTLHALADSLLGGSTSVASLEQSLTSSARVRIDGGFACLRENENLLEKSKRRARSHRVLNGHARTVAEAFARDLASACPYIDCIALSGSVASGGYDAGDDIDFDLFVRPGTKYVCYFTSLLTGLKYSWRYRRVTGGNMRRIGRLPKVVCINVVWTEDETRPFSRQDAALAFELLRCQPLVGATFFSRTLERNRWLTAFFPQLFARPLADEVGRRKNRLARTLEAIGQRAVTLRILEGFCRVASWLIYSFVQGIWGRDPVTRARMEFLRRVKYPYEVFQE